jgi:hypothetical protein
VNTIDDYFSSLTRFLQKHKSIIGLEPEFPFQRITDQFGRVNARLSFFDGSYLDIDEMVRIERGGAVNYNYRYHYQRPDEPVITYDDTPHHPELETFPHHSHPYRSGHRETTAHEKVTLTAVIQQILDGLEKK